MGSNTIESSEPEELERKRIMDKKGTLYYVGYVSTAHGPVDVREFIQIPMIDDLTYHTLSVFIDGVYKGKWRDIVESPYRLFAIPENKIELWLPKSRSDNEVEGCSGQLREENP